MINGFVTSNREARIRIVMRSSGRQETQVEAVIDTGFNGFLTLPSQFITNLALPFAGTTCATLGDGSEAYLDVFEATVLWDNQERDIVVFAAEGEALVGMSILSGYRVTLEIEDGGAVTIEALS